MLGAAAGIGAGVPPQGYPQRLFLNFILKITHPNIFVDLTFLSRRSAWCDKNNFVVLSFSFKVTKRLK